MKKTHSMELCSQLPLELPAHRPQGPVPLSDLTSSTCEHGGLPDQFLIGIWVPHVGLTDVIPRASHNHEV